MERVPALLVCCALALAACTSEPTDDASGSAVDGAETTLDDTNPSSLPSRSDDEPESIENDGDGDGEGDAADAPDDGSNDPGPTTPQTIVPPGETAPPSTADTVDNGDGGESTTTSVGEGVETTDRSEQPIQEQDTALVCAIVEQGYISVLSGSDDVSDLESGAARSVASGVTDYVDLGEALADALESGDGVQEAADALLTRCEADGFERLA